MNTSVYLAAISASASSPSPVISQISGSASGLRWLRNSQFPTNVSTYVNGSYRGPHTFDYVYVLYMFNKYGPYVYKGTFFRAYSNLTIFAAL